MDRVLSVKALPDFCLSVEFADGTSGVVALSDRLFGPMFEPLKDRAFFERVSVDEFGAVCWPNGADLAPDGLYHRIKNHKLKNQCEAKSEPAASAL